MTRRSASAPPIGYELPWQLALELLTLDLAEGFLPYLGLAHLDAAKTRQLLRPRFAKALDLHTWSPARSKRLIAQSISDLERELGKEEASRLVRLLRREGMRWRGQSSRWSTALWLLSYRPKREGRQERPTISAAELAALRKVARSYIPRKLWLDVFRADAIGPLSAWDRTVCDRDGPGSDVNCEATLAYLRSLAEDLAVRSCRADLRRTLSPSAYAALVAWVRGLKHVP